MVKNKPMPALDERQPIEEAFREAQSVLRNPRLDKSAKKAIYDKRLHNYLMLRKTEMSRPQKVQVVGEAKKAEEKKPKGQERKRRSSIPQFNETFDDWYNQQQQDYYDAQSEASDGEEQQETASTAGSTAAPKTPPKTPPIFATPKSKSYYRTRAPAGKRALDASAQRGTPKRGAAAKADEGFQAAAQAKAQEIVDDLYECIMHRYWIFNVEQDGTILDARKKKIAGSNLMESIRALVMPDPSKNDPPGTQVISKRIRASPSARMIYMQTGEGFGQFSDCIAGERRVSDFKPQLWTFY